MILEFFVPSERKGKRGRPLNLPGRNEIEAAARLSARGAGSLKKAEGERIAAIAKAAAAEQGWERPSCRVRVYLEWHETGSRERDQDNIRGYEKIVLDGLCPPTYAIRTDRGGRAHASGRPYGAGVIDDDGPRCIKGFSVSTMVVDPEHPGVKVRLVTVDESERDDQGALEDLELLVMDMIRVFEDGGPLAGAVPEGTLATWRMRLDRAGYAEEDS